MRVYHYLGNSIDACLYNRFLLPARYCQPYLKDQGIQLDVEQSLPLPNEEFDVFVWHGIRTPFNTIADRLLSWKQKGKKIVWSVDDDYPAIPAWNPASLDDKQISAFIFFASFADTILCSTDTLAKTFLNKNTVVAPNMLEIPLYRPNRDPATESQIRILYAGSNTHRNDMIQLIEPVTAILEEYPNLDIRFYFMGDCHPEIRRRHLYNGIYEPPPCRLEDYHEAVRVIGPDIWLAPIIDCKFNHSKSNLKVIEGMATGAAVIAANIGPYHKETVKEDIKPYYTVETEEEWISTLSILIESKQQRLATGSVGFNYVSKYFNWHSKACLEPWLNYYRYITGKGEKTCG